MGPWEEAANLDCPTGNRTCHPFPGPTRCLILTAGSWEIPGEICLRCGEGRAAICFWVWKAKGAKSRSCFPSG